MTPHPATGEQALGTGDILLASALMALGIPLDPVSPCETIQKDDGRSYGRFHLLPHSMDGKQDTHTMSRAWSRLEDLPADHPFAWLMTFVATRPRGVSSVSDWLGWAVDHCRDLGIDAAGLPGNIERIPDFVKAQPDSRAAYIFAFVHCRDLAMLLYQKERRTKVMMSAGPKHHVIMDTRLPKPVRSDLLSRLEGS